MFSRDDFRTHLSDDGGEDFEVDSKRASGDGRLPMVGEPGHQPQKHLLASMLEEAWTGAPQEHAGRPFLVSQDTMEIPLSFICNSCQHEHHQGLNVKFSEKEFIGMHQKLDKSLHIYTFPCDSCGSELKIRELENGRMKFMDFTAREKAKERVQEYHNENLQELYGSTRFGIRSTENDSEIVLQQKDPQRGTDEDSVQLFYSKMDAENKTRMIEKEREINYLQQRQNEFWKDNARSTDKMIEHINERKEKSRRNASHIIQSSNKSTSASVTRRKIRQSSIFGQNGTPLATGPGTSIRPSLLKHLSQKHQRRELKRKRQLEAFRESQKQDTKRKRQEETSAPPTQDTMQEKVDESLAMLSAYR